MAIPTIDARPNRAFVTAIDWERKTCFHADIRSISSTAGTTWAAGLNHIWEQVRDDPPDVFVCGSDDMVPHDDRWLPAVLPWLNQNFYPAPRVSDPRFENYAGPDHPGIIVPDGTPTFMSTFPILAGSWLDHVFPLPDDLHYFADNLLAVKLMRAGVDTVAVPSCRIIHQHAQEGRGAGYGSENNRLYIDTVRYTKALEQLGVERAGLPKNLRGHMWEQHFHDAGIAYGA